MPTFAKMNLLSLVLLVTLHTSGVGLCSSKIERHDRHALPKRAPVGDVGALNTGGL